MLGGGGVHIKELAGHMWKLHPYESGSFNFFAFVGQYVDEGSLWTPQRRRNVWWFGGARSDLWVFSEKVHSLNR